MNQLGPISAMLAAGGFVVLVAFLLPVLVFLARSANSLSDMMDKLNKEWEPMLKDAKGVTGNLVEVSHNIVNATERAVKLMDAIGHVGEGIHDAEDFVEERVRRAVSSLAVWLSRSSDWLARAMKWRGRMMGRV